jgi:hypothetical protein
LAKGAKGASPLETKYLNQLTLAVIESESLIPPSGVGQAKPGTAGNARLAATLEATQEEDYETLGGESLTVEREQEPAFDGDTITASASSTKNDWRQFFTLAELTTAFEKI